MVEYLSFQEVASILKCSTSKIRQFVVEDKTLKANRITPNGMVLELPVWDGYCAYGLDMCCHLSDEGEITSDIYGSDSTGKTVLEKTLNVGFLRVERTDLDIFTTTSGSAIKEELGSSNDPSARWPWGNHHTELLGHLEAAALRYWVNYDPTDATTAPTNKDVSEWLMNERKLPQKPAESIASMLRPDRLPTGPRK